MKISKSGEFLAQFRIRYVLRDRIKAVQSRDPILVVLRRKFMKGSSPISILIMKVFFGSVEDCVFQIWII